MELEQPILRSSKAYISPNQGQNYASNIVSSPIQTSSQVSDDLSHHRILENGAPPATDSADKKLSWLRSQIIGGDMEFDSPFGKRRLTYADHTASGRGLKFIEDYIMNNVLPFYGNSHTSDSYVGYKTTKMVHEAAEYVKRCLGGGQDDAILFCGSGSTAAIKRLQEVMGIAIPSIMRDKVFKSLSSEYKRWVVFVGPYEHHSNILSWRQSLAEVVEISLDENGLLDMEALRLQLREYQGTNRPMLGSFSACSNVTGTYTDTGALARLLHQFGAYACFDFAQQVIDKQEHDYIKAAMDRLLPNQNIWILGNISAKRQAILSFLIYSTTYSSSAEISFNLDEKEVRGLYLWRETGNKRDKPLHGPFVAKLLNDLFGIQARGGCACAGPYGHSLLNVDERLSLSFKSAIQMGYNGVKPGWTRISFPYYMSHEEFEFTLAALEFIAIYGQRHSNVNSHELQEHHEVDANSDGLINKYASYLEAAKRIAGLLPTFPPQRRVPDDLDLNLVPFRV
ncbi:hypothetical protein Acr_07g0010450 [Actinidia rufa]|uniref:Aminotransferase class V domain-containing protein n=1 Tax=Actinidia rufa TaxID=165716 RepID=A0A7J0EWS9_9ERIC|nr:hypothetical protein Acr_07g0010450 [Actinidia rufa]